jgi:acetyl-CoA carboxylase carboxyl transferase subunit alpha
LGGAHRDVDAMASQLQARLVDQVDRLSQEPIDRVLDRRYQRLMSYGNP